MVRAYSFSPAKKKNIFNILSVTLILIILNVVAFIIFSILLGVNVPLDYVAIKSANIFQGKYLWTFFTSMFTHGGLFHLFANMVSLFFVGSLVERLIGRKRYIWFYIISGIFAGLIFVVFANFFGTSEFGSRVFGGPEDFAVGASGAIFGLLGLLAVLIPHKKIYLIAGPLIAIVIQSLIGILFPGNSILNLISIFVTIYIFIAIFTLFSFNNNLRKISLPLELQFWILPIVAIVPLTVISLFVKLPIGNTAHLGGLIAGLCYGFYLRNKYKRKVKLLEKYFN